MLSCLIYKIGWNQIKKCPSENLIYRKVRNPSKLCHYFFFPVILQFHPKNAAQIISESPFFDIRNIAQSQNSEEDEGVMQDRIG